MDPTKLINMMVTTSPKVFFTRQSEAELVVPAKPTPHETKLLSDIDDQQGLRFQLPFVMFYRNRPSKEGDDPAWVIREALAEALVHYYPLAGRLREGPNRKLMVECNAEGVAFVEADASISLSELGLSLLPPCPYVNHFLSEVPGSEDIVGGSLLLVQVTRLTCGSFVLCVRMNHCACDSLGLVQFLHAVAELARGGPTISRPPVWQRHLLSARHPPRVTRPHPEYHEPQPIQTPDSDPHNQTAHCSFFFGPKHILALRHRLPLHLQHCSTFELLTACLWKCRTEALNLKPNETVSISPFITVRGKRGIELPEGYYGNAFAFPMAISEAGSLCRKPLGYAVELIREAKAEMSSEYVRSVADLMVVEGRPMYRRRGNYMVGDTSRAGFESVDFGWGKAVYGGPVGAIPGVSFYGKFRNGKGEDGIVVPVLLPRPAMERFVSLVMNITGENEDVNEYCEDHSVPFNTISRL